MSDWRKSELGAGRRAVAETLPEALAPQLWPREEPRVLLGVAVLERWARYTARVVAAGTARRRAGVQTVPA